MMYDVKRLHICIWIISHFKLLLTLHSQVKPFFYETVLKMNAVHSPMSSTQFALKWENQNDCMNIWDSFCFLIHTSNKIALQFHKINVPIYIYTEKKHTVHYPPWWNTIQMGGVRNKNEHHETIQAIQCSAKQAQLYIETCNCSMLGWEREKKGQKMCTFTVLMDLWGFYCKKYCRQAKWTLHSVVAGVQPSLGCVSVRRSRAAAASIWLGLLNLRLKTPVKLALLIVHLTQDHVVL